MEAVNNFEKLRLDLLSEVMICEDLFNIDENFKNKFFKIIELCNFSLMKDEDNFFAQFMLHMERKIKWDLPTATGVTMGLSHFTIYFNPFIFLQCNLLEMQALIKHEIYHILSLHLVRARKFKEKYSSLAINTAMDIAINQYIQNLPTWAERIENVRMAYNVDLIPERTMEEYVEEIQKAIDKMKIDKPKNKDNKDQSGFEQEHDSSRAHDLWRESEEFDLQHLKQLSKKVASLSSKGKVPASAEKFIGELKGSPEIKWNEYLKKLMGTLPYGKKKISTRRNRRQPDRMDLRGSLSNHSAKLLVALDISGSMSDGEINQAMTEILSIVKNYHSEVTIIECDTEIRRVYKVKNSKGIKQKVNTKGGTKFSPVFEYMNKNNMWDYILIYFTDGCGESELTCVPKNYKTLWVLSGSGDKLSLHNPFGIVKKLKEIKKDEDDVLYMRNEFKENVWVWHDSARF